MHVHKGKGISVKESSRRKEFRRLSGLDVAKWDEEKRRRVGNFEGVWRPRHPYYNGVLGCGHYGYHEIEISQDLRHGYWRAAYQLVNRVEGCVHVGHAFLSLKEHNLFSRDAAWEWMHEQAIIRCRDLERQRRRRERWRMATVGASALGGVLSWDAIQWVVGLIG